MCRWPMGSVQVRMLWPCSMPPSRSPDLLRGAGVHVGRGVGTLGPPLQARLPADAAPGVYRICELRECREFEYRP